MSNDLYDFLDRIATSLEGILQELKTANNVKTSVESKSVEEKPVEQNVKVDKKSPKVRIQQYFEEKGFEVFHTCDIEKINPIFVAIANNIGSTYSAVEPLMKEIKRHLAKGQQFALCVKEYSPQEITAMCGLANTLKQNGFLKEYVYKKSPQFLIMAKPENVAPLHNFFTGQWLEYYTANVARSLISSRRGSKSINLNTEVRDKADEITEFDVIVTFRDEIFWIECKTGEYKKYIDKYEKIARKLGMDSNHAFLVIAGIDDANVKALNAEHNITICNVENFKSVFESSLNSSITNE